MPAAGPGWRGNAAIRIRRAPAMGGASAMRSFIGAARQQKDQATGGGPPAAKQSLAFSPANDWQSIGRFAPIAAQAADFASSRFLTKAVQRTNPFIHPGTLAPIKTRLQPRVPGYPSGQAGAFAVPDIN